MATAMSKSEDVAKALKLGANDFVSAVRRAGRRLAQRVSHQQSSDRALRFQRVIAWRGNEHLRDDASILAIELL